MYFKDLYFVWSLCIFLCLKSSYMTRREERKMNWKKAGVVETLGGLQVPLVKRLVHF